jgi:CBS domain containing-hemolysin-like protein
MSIGAFLVAILLVVLNGFFVAVEFAFTASRRQHLEELAEGGSRFARYALASMDELPFTFAGAQLGVAGASLALGFVIENSLEVAFEDLYGALGLPRGMIAGAGVVTALLIVSFVHNVFGEMAPKNATIAAPERAALVLAGPFRVYVTVLRPIIVALTWVATGVLRIMGVKPKQSVESTHTAADIASLVKTVGRRGIIEDASTQLLTAAIGFRDTSVAEVMAPRPDLVALPASATPTQFERTVVRTGHSRIPVFGDNLDDIQGFVHAKDLLSIPQDRHEDPITSDVIRHLPVVPELMSVAPVMEMMRSTRTHIAVAIDEHGTTAGIVTLEDIAEELVGEIRDEHDIREVMEIRPAGRDRFLVAGQTRIDRLAEVGARIPPGRYETVGGFLMEQLGRVPRHGDVVTEETFEMSVRRMDGRRVREVELVTVTESAAAQPDWESAE